MAMCVLVKGSHSISHHPWHFLSPAGVIVDKLLSFGHVEELSELVGDCPEGLRVRVCEEDDRE